MFPRNENRNEGTFGCSPGTKNRNEGTFAKTTLLENHPFGNPRSCALETQSTRLRSTRLQAFQLGNPNGALANGGLAQRRQLGPKRPFGGISAAPRGCEVRRSWSQSAPKRPRLALKWLQSGPKRPDFPGRIFADFLSGLFISSTHPSRDVVFSGQISVKKRQKLFLYMMSGSF